MTKHPEYKSSWPISTSEIDTLAKHSAQAELEGDLHRAQRSLILQRNWLKMFVPENHGGLGYSLPKVLNTEEALAYADGSTGWVVTLCSGAAWFIGFVDAAERWRFETNDAWVAGSGASTGTAEEISDGYLINGEWRYASGCNHATLITANCILTRNGSVLKDEHGNPRIKSFFFLKSEVEIIKNWTAMGMVATGSHGFAIRNLVVSKHRSFVLDAANATLADAVYRYSFLQLAETTLTVNISGMAFRFIELSKEIVRSPLHGVIEQTLHELHAARKKFYQSVNTSWKECESKKIVDEEILYDVSKSSYKLFNTAMSSVSTATRYLGLAAVDRTSNINRVWRNLTTAAQHSLFRRNVEK